MSDAIKPATIQGRAPTAEENELLDWAEGARRGGITAANEGLRQLVTLTTAVLGGSAALLGQLPMLLPFKVVGVLLLVFALGVALWGSLPREATVTINSPEEIKDLRERWTLRKMQALKGSGGLLLLSLAVLLLGLLVSSQ